MSCVLQTITLSTRFWKALITPYGSEEMVFHGDQQDSRQVFLNMMITERGQIKLFPCIPNVNLRCVHPPSIRYVVLLLKVALIQE